MKNILLEIAKDVDSDNTYRKGYYGYDKWGDDERTEKYEYLKNELIDKGFNAFDDYALYHKESSNYGNEPSSTIYVSRINNLDNYSPKSMWLAGYSKMNRSDLDNKQKFDESVEESIKQINELSREFITITLVEENTMFKDKVVVTAELRVIGTIK